MFRLFACRSQRQAEAKATRLPSAEGKKVAKNDLIIDAANKRFLNTNECSNIKKRKDDISLEHKIRGAERLEASFAEDFFLARDLQANPSGGKKLVKEANAEA
jgi:hypothetical protein